MTDPETAPEEPRSATPGEQAAFRLGITVAIDMALAAADAIEVRPDAGGVRQRAAIAALHGLSEGLKATFLDAARSCISSVLSDDAIAPISGSDSTANP